MKRGNLWWKHCAAKVEKQDWGMLEGVNKFGSGWKTGEVGSYLGSLGDFGKTWYNSQVLKCKLEF